METDSPWGAGELEKELVQRNGQGKKGGHMNKLEKKSERKEKNEQNNQRVRDTHPERQRG